MITSPVTGGATKKIGEIPTQRLIELYRPYTDVTRFFTNLESVEIYECVDTGYRFYYPFTVAGDGPFYEDLSREPLYYVPWKWEHDIADSYIKENDTVLEQGCANGAFLLAEQSKKRIAMYGTEINEAARREADAKGVSFQKTTEADVVCSFQVLEHIADVQSFIQEAIDAAKPGGYILFSVPNNDSFLKDDQNCFLNMPPHHMGLWTTSVFKKLTEHYPLAFATLHTEHLQPNHYRAYYQTYFGNKLIPLGFFGKVLNKTIYTLFVKPFIAMKAKNITGHTMVAVFQKNTL